MVKPKGSMSTEGETLQVFVLPYRCSICTITVLTSAASPRVDISSTCKVGEKLGVSLPLLTCSASAWPSRLLYHRGRKYRRDLWITLYIFYTNKFPAVLLHARLIYHVLSNGSVQVVVLPDDGAIMPETCRGWRLLLYYCNSNTTVCMLFICWLQL